MTYRELCVSADVFRERTDWSLYAVTECDVHVQGAIVRMILWHNALSCYVVIACYFVHAFLQLRTDIFLTFSMYHVSPCHYPSSSYAL